MTFHAGDSITNAIIMDFEQNSHLGDPKLAEMFTNLTNISKQLSMIQGFMESKFGSEFSRFCQLTGSPTSMEQTYASMEHESMQDDDTEDYDRMPNLVSQENPSRTLGYVTVPLRQTISTHGGIPTPKLHPAPSSNSAKRDRGGIVKEEDLESVDDNDDIMYPLHNFPDLLVESAAEAEANETPEFLELELDPSALLRGEPPALHPMFADAEDEDVHISNKRSSSRQGSNFNRFEGDSNVRANGNASRRASVGGHESNVSPKKFVCLVCGIKFEFAETLKSHMDSHTGSRSIRSNSEDQSGAVNNPGAPPLPKLMPRPSIPATSPSSDSSSVEMKLEEPPIVKPSKSKKSSHVPRSPSSPSSSGSSHSMKQRKRYNQSRPCSLVCPECGLKIRDRSRLIEHLRGHTGERPFQCSYCDKSYTRKDVLKTHIIKMHGDSVEAGQYA